MLLDRKTGCIKHAQFPDLPEFISAATVMVLNDSRVRKARLFGSSVETGSRVEFLLLEQLREGTWKALTNRARRQRPGRSYLFPENVRGTVVDASGVFCFLSFSPAILEAYLELHGHVPLPPYIDRTDTVEDAERYQTIYARHTGSTAAPTAGLHLTDEILGELQRKGVHVASATLHVGAGTFLPIRSETLEEHVMHEEAYRIPEASAGLINEAVRSGSGVLAVGTTVVRALESACRDGQVAGGEARSSLFIYPGYRFRVVTQLLTNFHTPRSTLLALVAAFAGREKILEAYRQAVWEKYRFYSYGDAMLIQ